MVKVFLLEDNDREREEFREALQEVSPGAVLVETKDLASALEVLDAKDQVDFDVLVFDLEVPPSPDPGPEYDLHEDGALNGLIAAERASKMAHGEIFVVSQYTDLKPHLKAKREAELRGCRITDWLRKEVDLGSRADFRAHFEKYLIDWQRLGDFVEAERGLSSASPAFQRLLKQLTYFVHADLSRKAPPLPALWLGGPYGAGKTSWGKALATIKEYLLSIYRIDVSPHTVRKAEKQVNIPSLPDFQGNERIIRLVGSRKFSASKTSFPDEDGALVQATEYRTEFERPIMGRAGNMIEKALVWHERSGYVVADEVLHGPSGIVELLIPIIDKGSANPAGQEYPEVPIGCGIVLTTNIAPENRREEGLDAFITRCERVTVPGLDQVWFSDVVTILAQMFRKEESAEVVLAPAALDLLAKEHDRQRLHMRVLSRIVARAKAQRVKRITDGIVKQCLRQSAEEEDLPGADPVARGLPIKENVAPELRTRSESAGITRSTTSKYRIPKDMAALIGATDIDRALMALREIRRTNGESIGHDLVKGTVRDNLGPSEVLALLIIIMGYIADGSIQRSEVVSWFGLRSWADLKGRVRSCRDKYRWPLNGLVPALERWGQQLAAELPALE